MFMTMFGDFAPRLKSVWDDEIVASARLAISDVDAGHMRRMEFYFPKDPCAYEISIYPGKERFDVPLSHNYVAFSFSYILPMFLYLVGEPEFDDASRVIDYVMRRMHGQIRDFQAACLDRASSFSLVSPAAELFGSQHKYTAAMVRLSSQPGTMHLANEIAGLPIIFVMLHEYAHAYFGHHNKDFSPAQETEADQFAARIFEQARLPAMFGALGILVFQADAHQKSNERALSCRLAALMDEKHMAQTASAFATVEQGVQRLTALQAALRRLAKGRCDAG
ncbi:hypothetical protein D1F64_19895 [Breoghania sp. L-A4]|nr:hypothetical protein D1F64_19895 [Breoghania sp. L-A4]